MDSWNKMKLVDYGQTSVVVLTSLFIFSRAFLASMPLVCACSRITAFLLRFHSFLARCPRIWACSTRVACLLFLYRKWSWRERTCACSLAKPSCTWNRKMSEGLKQSTPPFSLESMLIFENVTYHFIQLPAFVSSPVFLNHGRGWPFPQEFFP